MTEFELKLEVPAARFAAVQAAVAATQRQRLRAVYFDTPDAQLARAGIVVRLRREAGRWVQTAKAGGGSALERLEHNAELADDITGTGKTPPPLELSRHAGTPLERKIRHALGLRKRDALPLLLPVFETDVRRELRVLTVGKSLVEIALDRGHVQAGTQRQTLCEIEFELKRGRPEDAVRLARSWCAAHGAWLSTVSKSAKAWALVDGAPPRRATGFQAPRYAPDADARDVVRSVLQACLDQILPNASAVAAGSSDTEHIHQLRVGIRRLRTALRTLQPVSRDIPPAWREALTALFRVLGRHRDQTLRVSTLAPQLQAAGGPPFEADGGQALPDLRAAVRSPAFQDVLLGLLALAHRQASASARQVDARPPLRQQLEKLHRQVVKGGRDFLSLDDAGQHQVRKQLKRLRYLAEFSAPLFPRRNLAHFVSRLAPAQDAMGVYNDELTALNFYRQRAEADPRALFGVGWLSARRAANAQACVHELKALAGHPPFKG